MQIKDKIAIVTGASGIGLALAWLLSRKGATVILAARSADKLKQLEQEIPGSLAIATDMLKLEDIRNLIPRAKEKFGRIDILVNNGSRCRCATRSRPMRDGSWMWGRWCRPRRDAKWSSRNLCRGCGEVSRVWYGIARYPLQADQLQRKRTPEDLRSNDQRTAADRGTLPVGSKTLLARSQQLAPAFGAAPIMQPQ